MKAISARAILFDLDGVLVDSIASIDKAVELWCGTKGIEYEGIKIQSRSLKDDELIRFVDSRLDVRKEKEIIKDLEIQNAYLVTAHRHAQRITRELDNQDVPWAIATSGQREVAVARLLAAGIRPPQVMITCDDCTQGKPSKEPYSRAADLLGVVPEDCIVIEDTLVGITAGKAAGATTIAVTTTYPRTFFGEVPDMVIESLGEIIVSADGVFVNR